ncbi:MAG: hypothetical protein H0W45_03130 [Acidobacteria bacterium]|nr:hypothetical protein [Acidobacteriota bacterium]
MIFPEDKVYLYYLYRPLSYVDGAVMGMNFHIRTTQVIKMELTDLQTKYEKIKVKVEQLGRYL